MLCLMIERSLVWIVSGFPSTLAVTPIMKEHFPDDYKGVIASPESWERIVKKIQKLMTR